MDDSSHDKERAIRAGGIPPQVSRLALTFLALIGAFFLLRSQTVPSSFGKDGFYRAQAVTEIAASPVRFAGKAACADCHSDKLESTAHYKAGVSCESCHPTAMAHTEDPGSVKPDKPSSREFCGKCHGKAAGRDSVPTADLSTHNAENACIDCHTVHESQEAIHE